MARYRPVIWSAILLVAMIPFQNCSNRIQPQNDTLKAEGLVAAKAHLGPGLGCADFKNYQCEHLIFSPDIEPMVHFLSQCLSSDSICVDVETRAINTSAAPEEFRCRHRYAYRNVAIFESEGASLEEALAAVMNTCERAVEKL